MLLRLGELTKLKIIPYSFTLMWNNTFMWLLVTIAGSQWLAIFEIGKCKNSSWTPWRAKGGFVPCGIPLPTCILLHNRADYLCGWRGGSEWLTININLLMIFKWDISICSLLCCVFLLLFYKSGILNSIQFELDEGER